MTTSAREDTTRLAVLLRREHHALAEFLIALAAFDAERRWAELGHTSLFSFLTRELHLSAGAAQYRAGRHRDRPPLRGARRGGVAPRTSGARNDRPRRRRGSRRPYGRARP